MVEHLPFKQGVESSILSAPIAHLCEFGCGVPLGLRLMRPTPSGDVSLATSITARLSAMTASTTWYLCSVTLISFMWARLKENETHQPK